MDLILNIPFIIKIIATLIIILVTNKLSKNLIISVIVGTLILAFWSGHSIFNVFHISWARFSSTNNILLMIIIFQVIWLSSQMKESGVMADLVKNVRSKISQKASMAVLPALIGLLPMPGGAIFSAPMVDDCDHDKSIHNHLKTKINYWFRHIWEYWWPLYPGVLLAIDITGLQVWQFILLQLPLSFFSILGGTFFLLRHIKSNKINKSDKINDVKTKFIFIIMPILIVILIYAAIMLFFPRIVKISKYLPMAIGLLASQIVLQFQRPLNIEKWKNILLSIKTIKLATIVAFIRIYGAFIEAKLSDGTLLMDHVREELFLWNIPIIAIIMIIPFISGLTTGIAIGFVGASFPIVINLLGTNPELNIVLAYTVLAYGFGYIGMILSPVHVCLLVTNEYFKTNLIQNIIQLIKPASVVLACAIVMHVVLRFV